MSSRPSTTLPAAWHFDPASAIQDILAEERALGARNRLVPYADLLPRLLPQLAPDLAAAALAEMAPSEVCQALFGNFRELPWDFVIQLLTVMAPDAIAALLPELAIGVDRPRLAARLIAAAGPTVAPGWLAAGQPATVRIAGLMGPASLAAILTAASRQARRDWIATALVAAYPAEAATLLDVVRLLPRPECLEVFDLVGASAITHPWVALDGAPVAVAAFLARLPGSHQRDALSRLDAARAAELLTELASSSPSAAGFLLATQSELILTRGPEHDLRRVLYGSRGAALLRRFDYSDDRVTALLGRVPRELMSALLARTDIATHSRMAALTTVTAPGFAPTRYPPTRTRGCRRSRWLAEGTRWIHVEEMVASNGCDEALRTDLLELDPSIFDLVACRAPGRLPPIQQAVAQLGGDGRFGSLPDESAFEGIGLVQLAGAVARGGAGAGINGGFYTDYGLCLDAHDLGIDLSQESNLRLGDVVGWFVRDGHEIAPPLFNRAVLAVTADGRAHLRRVQMVDVVLSNGHRLTWEAINRVLAGGTVLYDRVAGTVTPPNNDRVELAVSRSTITAIRPGGSSNIPLLGFVVSIPAGRAWEILAGVRVGQEVRVGNDFPPELGRVREAMACGPLLVRDGQVDLDFDAEGFGTKDSTVLPLSLSRVVDTFRAARSFVMVRAGAVFLGTVSGTMLGSGPPRVSAGMTFGELAQLCVDLDADDAIGLDGGGSSSLVASVDGVAQVLNIPTGGSDVPEGTERFIKTYWLARAR